MENSFVGGTCVSGLRKRLSQRQALLLASCAIGCLLAAAPALADGGQGGSGNPGGGGVDNPMSPGGSGGLPSASWGGGGGGGAGSTGGNGSDGIGIGAGSGGAGGSSDGASGADGTSGGTNYGGGGGGGGAHGFAETALGGSFFGYVAGGNGGKGGDSAGFGGGGGGGGGAGGYGAVFDGSAPPVLVFSTGVIIGGNGGNGGSNSSGYGGSAGSGGVGFYFPNGAALTNEGTIGGGNGGARGTGGSGDGSDGNGGAGVVGGGLWIYNAGTIVGGVGGDGVTRANAITFTGGTNSLTIAASSTITGNVVAFSTNDTLALGGSANQTFDVSQIGATSQYRGFGHFLKNGISTWTLTGTTSEVTPWTISAGTLKVGSDGNLGDSSGGITFDGGTLQWGASFDLASTRTVTLNGGGGTFDTNGFDTTIAQGIIGAGALTKTGLGKLILTGANAYTGGTTISAGTLQGDAASLTGDILDNAALIFDQGTDGTFGGAITGTGALTKTGLGLLILNDSNGYTGGTTVSAGALEVGDASHPGASLAGNVTVGAAGTLMGHGTVGGDVVNNLGGIVSPGGSIGTLFVGGNYTQGAGSTLSIELTPTNASALAVTGTASLDGTLNLVYAPGVYGANSFTIVSAASVTGTFATTTSNAPGLFQSLDYTSTSVILSPSGGFDVAPADDTAFSALGVAALDGAQGATGTLLGYLDGLHGGNGGVGSASLGPVRAAPVQIAMAGDAANLDGLLASDTPTLRRAWVQATGRFASLDGNGTVPGFDTTSGGFMAGIDKPFGESFVAGIAAGYAQTYVDENAGSSGHIGTPRVALYGGYAVGGFALDATLGYAHDFIDSRRFVTPVSRTATASHDGDEVTAALQASLNLDMAGATVVPRAGLQYVHLSEESFSESGAPGFNLDVASRDADSLRPFIGVSAAKSFAAEGGTTLTPRLDLEYSRETMNNAPSNTVTVGGGSFIVDGLQPSRDRVTLGAGIDAKLSNALTLHAGYRATLPTGNLFEQTVEAGVSYAF